MVEPRASVDCQRYWNINSIGVVTGSSDAGQLALRRDAAYLCLPGLASVPSSGLGHEKSARLALLYTDRARRVHRLCNSIFIFFIRPHKSCLVHSPMGHRAHLANRNIYSCLFDICNSIWQSILYQLRASLPYSELRMADSPV